MINMPHCRFSNTVLALEECHEHMDDEDLSPAEKSARDYLAHLCHTIALEEFS
jgi:hypothetical protein